MQIFQQKLALVLKANSNLALLFHGQVLGTNLAFLSLGNELCQLSI